MGTRSTVGRAAGVHGFCLGAFQGACLVACFLGTGRAMAQAPKPAPDVIVFTNGDQLSGQLERGVGNSVVFKSDMAGEITVPLDKVKELRSSGSFAVLRRDQPISRKVVHTGTVLYSDGSITVADPVGPSETVPVKEMAFLIDQMTYDRELERKPGPFYGWNGSVSAGATVVRATQNGTTLSTLVALVRTIPAVSYLPVRNRTSFDLAETYGRVTQPVIPQTVPPSPELVTKTSIFHSDAERDEYFKPHFYALAEMSFDHNYSQGLDLQEVYGAGVGWTPFKNPRQQLDVKADLHYEKQEFETVTSNQNLVGSSIAEAYRRDLPRKLVLTEQASVLPAWNNFDAYSANASVALALPLFRRLGMSLSSTDNFLNNPSAGFKKNSFQFMTNLNYTLR